MRWSPLSMPSFCITFVLSLKCVEKHHLCSFRASVSLPGEISTLFVPRLNQFCTTYKSPKESLKKPHRTGQQLNLWLWLLFVRKFFLHYEKTSDKCRCLDGKLHSFIQNIFQVFTVPLSCVPSFFYRHLLIFTHPV